MKLATVGVFHVNTPNSTLALACSTLLLLSVFFFFLPLKVFYQLLPFGR